MVALSQFAIFLQGCVQFSLFPGYYTVILLSYPISPAEHTLPIWNIRRSLLFYLEHTKNSAKIYISLTATGDLERISHFLLSPFLNEWYLLSVAPMLWLKYLVHCQLLHTPSEFSVFCHSP